MANAMRLTKKHARKVLAVVEQGLVQGLGKPEPGKMCVEAAVCFALGLPHGDNPPCVAAAVRRFKIRLNDANWPSDQDRAEGMKELSIAQLGSDGIDEKLFAEMVARETIKQVVPIALRAASEMTSNMAHKDKLLAAALKCEQEGTREAAQKARSVAYEAACAAATCAAAAEAAAYAYESAYAAIEAAACAAAACDAAACAAATCAAATCAAATCAAKQQATSSARFKVLRIAADIGVAALKVCGSIGCEWLDIVK